MSAAAAAAKSLQSCLTLCNPIDGSPPGSPVPGFLQARTLEWVAISFSNAWKWNVKEKSLSHVQFFATPWTAAYQAPLSLGFARQEYWSGVPWPSLSLYIYICVCVCVCVYIHIHIHKWQCQVVSFKFLVIPKGVLQEFRRKLRGYALLWSGEKDSSSARGWDMAWAWLMGSEQDIWDEWTEFSSYDSCLAGKLWTSINLH